MLKLGDSQRRVPYAGGVGYDFCVVCGRALSGGRVWVRAFRAPLPDSYYYALTAREANLWYDEEEKGGKYLGFLPVGAECCAGRLTGLASYAVELDEVVAAIIRYRREENER